MSYALSYSRLRVEDWEENIFVYEQVPEAEGAAANGDFSRSEEVDAGDFQAWNGGMEIAGIEEFVGVDAQAIRTGIESLDEDFGGGIPVGSLVEVAATKVGSGGQTFLLHLLETARREKRLAAVVDGSDCFDPESAPPALLENLLWVRCDDGLKAMKAADALLRDDNFGMVLLDLRWNEQGELRRVKSADWYRLQRLTERSSACVCVFTPKVMIPSAQARLELLGGLGLGEESLSLQGRGQQLDIRALRLRKFETSAFPKLIRRATG